MSEQEPTTGATVEGAQAPSQTAVADAGTPAPSAPDLSKIDLSTLPQFREYDSKVQKRLAATERERADLAARVQQADITRMQENLRSQGLDERTIAQTTGPLYGQLYQLQRENVLLKLGMTADDIEPGDIGNSPEQFEANMTRKKGLREKEEALKLKEQEVARKEREQAENAKVSERETRRQSGADRQVAGDNEPAPGLEEAWRTEVRETRARHGDVALVNRKYRSKGLNI